MHYKCNFNNCFSVDVQTKVIEFEFYITFVLLNLLLLLSMF